MERDCVEEIDFARKPATGFAARDKGWDMTKRQAHEITGDVVLAGTRRIVTKKPKDDSELVGHLYYRQS